jgi:hypothetical protein
MKPNHYFPPNPVATARRLHRIARKAEQAAAVADLLPLPPNANELAQVLDSIPVGQLQFSGKARRQWRGCIKWLAWELARRGVRAPPSEESAACR